MSRRYLPCVLSIALLFAIVPAHSSPPDTTPTHMLWWEGDGQWIESISCAEGVSYIVKLGNVSVGDEIIVPPSFDSNLEINAAHPDESDFAAFVENLTDGDNQRLHFCFRTGFHEGGYTFEGCESYREDSMGAPDLTGYIIDHLQIRIYDANCSPLSSNVGATWRLWGQVDIGQPIAAIAASSRDIYPDDDNSLIVVLDRAKGATLEPGFGSIDPAGGTFPIDNLYSTTYTLTATNEVGTEIRQITISPQKPSVEFKVTPVSVFAGETATLSWSVAGATQIDITGVGEDLPATGTLEIVPEEPLNEYELIACNSLGCVSESVSVERKLPTARLYGANPLPAEIFELKVRIQGADSATLEPGFGAIPPENAEYQTSVTEPTTFTLTATNVDGTSVAEVLVSPQPPRISLTPSTTTPQGRAPVTFEVTIEGADSASLDPGPGSIAPVDGSYDLSFDQPETEVTLSATNVAGTNTASVTIAPHAIHSLTVDPPFIDPGDLVTVSWDVLDFASVTLKEFGAQANVGSKKFKPDRSMTFTILVDDGQEIEVATETTFVGSKGMSSLEVHFSDQELSPIDPVLEPFVPFDVYFMGVSEEIGIGAYEFSATFSECLSLLESEILVPNPVSIGLGNDNWIVGVGDCEDRFLFTPLLRYQFMATDDDCLESAMVDILPAIPSSFDPPVPAYLTCEIFSYLQEIVPFHTPATPLYLEAVTSVPAATVELEGSASAEGVQLTWETTVRGEWLAILRVDPGRPTQELMRVPASRRGQWVDRSANDDQEYRYRAVLSVDGTLVQSEDVVVVASKVPLVTQLLDNRPNPFNPRTEIRYQLAQPGDVRLEIYNAAGRRVRTQVMPHQIAGQHSWTWNGTSQSGAPVGSGVYYLRMTTPGSIDTRRLVLLK